MNYTCKQVSPNSRALGVGWLVQNIWAPEIVSEPGNDVILYV